MSRAAALKGTKRKNGVVTLAPAVDGPFTIHDLRAKSASDDELDDAHDGLANDNPRATQASIGANLDPEDV